MKRIIQTSFVILVVILTSCTNSHHNTTDKHDHYHMHETKTVASEKEFLYQMIPHHQEAVDSSQKLLQKISIISNKNEIIKNVEKLLNSIIKAQSEEIIDMKSWIKDFYSQDYKNDGTYKNMMSNAEFSDINKSIKTFLTDMVGHHEHAVMMAQETLQLESIHTEVKQLCNNIISSQQEEIKQMKLMIKSI